MSEVTIARHPESGAWYAVAPAGNYTRLPIEPGTDPDTAHKVVLGNVPGCLRVSVELWHYGRRIGAASGSVEVPSSFGEKPPIM